MKIAILMTNTDESDFAAAKERLRWIEFAQNFIPAFLLWSLLAFLLWRAVPGVAATGWIGPIAWLAYEVLFYAVYVARFGEYSFSSFAVASENLLFMALTSTALLIACLLFARFSALRNELAPGALMGLLLLAIAFKAAVTFGWLGLSGSSFHPGSFWIFTGLSFYMQLFTAAIVMIAVLVVRVLRSP